MNQKITKMNVELEIFEDGDKVFFFINPQSLKAENVIKEVLETHEEKQVKDMFYCSFFYDPKEHNHSDMLKSFFKDCNDYYSGKSKQVLI